MKITQRMFLDLAAARDALGKAAGRLFVLKGHLRVAGGVTPLAAELAADRVLGAIEAAADEMGKLAATLGALEEGSAGT